MPALKEKKKTSEENAPKGITYILNDFNQFKSLNLGRRMMQVIVWFKFAMKIDPDHEYLV